MTRAVGALAAAGAGLLLAALPGLVSGVTLGSDRGETRPEASAAVPAQELPDGVTAAMVERGRGLFTGPGLCYTCHGRDGSGRPDLGADLTDDRWLHGDGTYGYLVRRIREGVSAQASTSGMPMPPRAGADLTDEQVEAVAAYVWTLSRRSSPRDEPAGGGS